jgi:hypothetical protein
MISSSMVLLGISMVQKSFLLLAMVALSPALGMTLGPVCGPVTIQFLIVLHL